MSERSRRHALVTGASSGIGLAFARQLASRGYDLVVTARRRDRLETLAEELRQTHRVNAHVLVDDLSDAGAPERLARAIAEAGIAVDILINNAGYGVPGRYVSTSWEQQRAFLQVMVVAVSELTHRLLPGMIERQWGRVVNVASVAGLLPGVAGHTLYAASKAYMIAFSESLALETAEHGVHVTASCPGFTLSEFHDVTGTRHQVNQMPGFMWLDADRVARESYDAVMAGKVVYVPGRVYRSLTTIARLLPRRVVTKVMTRNAGKFRRV
ncbi:MAG TPA: SDR family oxidoreductase [Vicinamibacterales bacterium]|nr:SDR family oxidoreductase [Vicinamibacterales bacterium]